MQHLNDSQVSWMSELDVLNVNGLEISAKVLQFNKINQNGTVFDYKEQVDKCSIFWTYDPLFYLNKLVINNKLPSVLKENKRFCFQYTLQWNICMYVCIYMISFLSSFLFLILTPENICLIFDF